ncbi:MAG: hypothetical protein JWQ71_4100 [Pedosphaera sp.]|nr:hypothetical protein [Pedosphaera sp.]
MNVQSQSCIPIRKFMKKNLFLFGAVLATSLSAFAQTTNTIALWTFETTAPTTAGPISPETGSGSALGSHTSGSAVYSSPSGNGSAKSFSANFWG